MRRTATVVLMLEKFRSSIPGINAALFTSLFFFLPMHVAPVYVLSCAILTLSVIEGNFATKWHGLRQIPMFWIFQAFYWLFVLSLLWSSDIKSGQRMIGHYSFFLLSGLYLTVAKPGLAPRCIAIFLAGCAMAEVLAYYNWLQMHLFTDWPTGIRVRKTPEDTAPFVDRILYTPVLAWAGYLAARQALNSSGLRRNGYVALTLATLGNLIFSGGRSGQLTFLVLLVVLVFQHWAKRPAIAAILSIILVGGIASGSYSSSSYLRERIDLAVHEVMNYKEAENTSVGLRINFYANSIRLFVANPVLGVGAGDFAQEYEAVNSLYTPKWTPTVQPHNQYLYVVSTTGTIGGLVLLLTYFAPILWQRRLDRQTDPRVALVIFIAFISLFESYIWRSNTSLLYVLFATLLIDKPSTP